MELIDFIQTALQGSQRAIKRATDGLAEAELNWRPGTEANSIGLILFHNACSEDYLHSSDYPAEADCLGSREMA